MTGISGLVPFKKFSPLNTIHSLDDFTNLIYLLPRRNHDLTRHMKSHDEKKQHVCMLCGRQFARRDALKRHENMDSTGKSAHCVI